jgi:hypothetical protein
MSVNTIVNQVLAEVSGIAKDRVRVTVTDSTGEAKWAHLTPKGAHDLAVEILESAYEAAGVKDFRVLIGVAYSPEEQ